MSKQYFATSLISDAHAVDIFAADTTPDLAITCSGDSTVNFWSAVLPDHSLVKTLSTEHKLGIHHLCAHSEAGLLATSGFEGEVAVYSISDGTRLHRFSDSKSALWAIRFSPDGDFLAATTLDGRILVWNVSGETAEHCGTLEAKNSAGLCIDYSNDGLYIATGHEDGGVYLFSTESARLVHSLLGNVHPVRTVAFSPLSKLLAVAGDSSIITVYDVKSGEQVFNLAGHSRWVMSLDWNFTGEYIVSGSFDKSLKVWSIEKTECVATQNESDGPIWCVKWAKTAGSARPQGFIGVGADRSIRWYREAAGG
ncbi:WD40-repeat-containing domain protein [Limtongia smithiae]|uniref:WD40-repeat-containing domain protein n=1 Tax=Limtongia smithiae TaxID=1125753 RepID=UPI0034CEF899